MPEGSWKRFLLDQPHTAKISTVRRDGRPHVVPVWFDMDGDEVVFTTWHESVKARTLRRDPRVCVCVDDERPPFGYVMLEGTASLSDDPDELKSWATRIAARYMGPQEATAYGRRNGAAGELLVRVRPTAVVAEERIAD